MRGEGNRKWENSVENWKMEKKNKKRGFVKGRTRMMSARREERGVAQSSQRRGERRERRREREEGRTELPEKRSHRDLVSPGQVRGVFQTTVGGTDVTTPGSLPQTTDIEQG